MWAVLVSFFRLYLSLILLNTTHAGILPTLTGGSLFFHPRFNVARDGPVVESQLRRVLGCSITTSISMAAPGRDQDSGGGYGYGYDCTAKVRCSKGTFSFYKLSSTFLSYHLCSTPRLENNIAKWFIFSNRPVLGWDYVIWGDRSG